MVVGHNWPHTTQLKFHSGPGGTGKQPPQVTHNVDSPRHFWACQPWTQRSLIGAELATDFDSVGQWLQLAFAFVGASATSVQQELVECWATLS
jgi:hypothetical protein